MSPPRVRTDPAPAGFFSAWTTLALAWAVAAVALSLAGWRWPALGEALAWHRTQAFGHVWAWWTAPLVHLGPAHLVLDLLALGALALLGHRLGAPRALALAALLAWPLATLGLLAFEVAHCRGLSGLNHALAALLALWGVARAPGDARRLAAVLGVLLVLKLLAEQAWRLPVVAGGSWGFDVVRAAHLSGALAGVVAAVVAGALALTVQRARMR